MSHTLVTYLSLSNSPQPRQLHNQKIDPLLPLATNAIESLNMVMRKYTRNRRVFPNDDAALKALFLAIREASKNWKFIHHWKPALQSFQLMFGEKRVPLDAL